MTQQGAQRAHFGTSWPEVAGFGAGPNKHDFSRFGRRVNRKKFASVATEAFVAENANQDAFILTREQHKPPEPPKMPVEPFNGEDGETDGGEPENGAEGNTEGDDTPDKPKQSTRKYICPKCGCIIRATRDVHVICGECNVAFVKEQKNNA